MTPYQQEQIENIARNARKGLKAFFDQPESTLDLFQHILDITGQIKNDPNFIYIDTVDR
jgi:hypothetical protein